MKTRFILLSLGLLLALAGFILAQPGDAQAQTAPPAPPGIIGTGQVHTCALTPSGAVDCWGFNGAGQAADQPGPYTQVSTEVFHTCALTPSGAVDCWGDNYYGQVNGTPHQPYTNAFGTHAGPYTQISAESSHTCALTPSGAIECWGHNNYGQAPAHVDGPYTQVSAGMDYTCALTPSGAVDCWGNNDDGQAVDQAGPYTQVSTGIYHTCALTPSGAVDCWGVPPTTENYGQAAGQPGPYAQVSVAQYHTCALTPSGAVDCWGWNRDGQVDEQPGAYIQVSAGGHHTCALTPSGAVDCWGNNDDGQSVSQPGLYGPYIPDTAIDSAPADPSHAGVTFTFSSADPRATFECRLDTGGWAACASPKDYIVMAAGEHIFQVRASHTPGYPDLSPASTTWTVSSVATTPDMGIVSPGVRHTCALTPSGAVDCWGDNTHGQAQDQPGPYTQVSGGFLHTCALTPTGSVDCWGYNYQGQAADQPGPYTLVSAGYYHTCALTPYGAVDCWGDTHDHVLAGPYTQVSAGYEHDCALTPAGAVDCWGDNFRGQAQDQPGPYTQVSVGDSHTCALTPAGAVDCWGIQVGGVSYDQPGPYTQINAGALHTCALTPAGAVECWGAVHNGQAQGQPGPYTQVSAGSQTCALTPAGAVDCWNGYYDGLAAQQPGPYGSYVPLPVLSSLSPAAAVAGSGDLTLAVIGSSFVEGAKVRWNGTDLDTTFASESQLTAVVPAGSLGAVQTAQVTVNNPALIERSSAVLLFFVTQAAANVTGQQVASGEAPAAAYGPATATATGSGLLAVAQYDANPGGSPSFSASGTYFDVYAASGNTFSQVTIVACNLNGGDKLYWWDAGQSTWVKASPQTYDSATGCITLIVDASSSPSLSQLQGTFFAAGSDFNTAPIANPAGPYLAAINTTLAFDGSLSSDPENDTLTYAWDFGDGSTGTEVMPSHSYGAAAIYDVCLVVNDGSLDSSPVCTLAVVYDPSGGFVTGGGWIDSPAGAYIPDPTLIGKAAFGFVSKYQKGSNVPTGYTEFQFQAGGFNFHSTTYEWLVVNRAGTNAQFKGSGLVNAGLDPNCNEFKFMLWAGDGSSTGGADTFRIRIWWEDTGAVEHDVYDNGFDQAIGGGSIVVHTGM